MYIPTKGLWGRSYVDSIDNGEKHQLPELVRHLPQDKRTQLDVWLELGFQFYESLNCPMCGVSAVYGRTEHSHVEFDTTITTCYACAAKEGYMENNETKNGETVIAEPHGPRYINAEGKTVTDPLPTIMEAMAKIP